MISLALFGLIASGAMSLVMSGARTQAHSAHVDVAQSGLRAGMDFLSRDLLSAGAGVSSGNLVLGSTGGNLKIITVTDSSTGPDAIDIYTIDGSVINSTGIPVTVTQNVAASFSSITVDNAAPFKSGDLVQLCDLTNGVLVKLNGTSATTLTSTGTNVGPVGITFSAPPSSAYVFKSRHVTYSVAPTQFSNGASGTIANGSALMLDLNDGNGPQPLAEGVEDLQIALGIDNNPADHIITEHGLAANDDEWIYNVAGEADPVSLTALRAVRITIVAKATAGEPGFFPVRPAAENHAAGTVHDGFFRRVIRSEVAVRNFNL
jgi:hypothetical protein